jgi:hypothetical protein
MLNTTTLKLNDDWLECGKDTYIYMHFFETEGSLEEQQAAILRDQLIQMGKTVSWRPTYKYIPPENKCTYDKSRPLDR